MKQFVSMESFSHWFRERRDALLSSWMPVKLYCRLGVATLLIYWTGWTIYPLWIHPEFFWPTALGVLLILCLKGENRIMILIRAGAEEECAISGEDVYNRCSGRENHVCFDGSRRLKRIFYEVDFQIYGNTRQFPRHEVLYI